MIYLPWERANSTYTKNYKLYRWRKDYRDCYVISVDRNFFFQTVTVYQLRNATFWHKLKSIKKAKEMVDGILISQGHILIDNTDLVNLL